MKGLQIDTVSALANLETSVNELDAIARNAMANSEGELPHVASAHVRIWHTFSVRSAAAIRSAFWGSSAV